MSNTNSPIVLTAEEFGRRYGTPQERRTPDIFDRLTGSSGDIFDRVAAAAVPKTLSAEEFGARYGGDGGGAPIGAKQAATPYTVQQFAARVKQKYPAYESWPDDHLVTQVLTKYPEYKRWVATDVATDARVRLSERGLTAQKVKAGQGVTQPEDIHFDAPKSVNGGFVGGVFSNPLAGPIESVKHHAGAVLRGEESGVTAPLRVAADVLIPRPDLAFKEAMRRGAANESTSDMYGQVAQGAALAALSGPGTRTLGRVAGLTEAEAAAKVSHVIDPKGANAALANMVGEEVIRNGVPLKNPRVEVPAIAERKIQGIDTDTPILNRTTPAKVGPVLRELSETRRKMFDSNGTIRIGFEEKAKSLSALMRDIAKKADSNGYLPNDVLRNLHADLNYEVGPRGFDAARGAQTNPDRLSPTMHAARAVAEQVNSDPASAAANAQKSRWIDAKEKLPANAPDTASPKLADLTAADVFRIGRGLAGRGAVAGLAYAAGGPMAGAIVGAAEALTPSIRRIVTSPQWRTANAITRARVGKMLLSHNVTEAARALGLSGAASSVNEAENNSLQQGRE